MKILHSLVFFLPDKIGGIEVYVKELAKAQQEAGHDVTIIIPVWPGWSTDADYIHESIKVRTYLDRDNTAPKEFQGLVPSASLQIYQNILEQEKPDIVHFHQLGSSNGTSLFHMKAAKDTGAKIVFTAHLAGTTCYTNDLLYKRRTLCNGEVNLLKCTACLLQRMGVEGSPAASLLLSLNMMLVGKPWNVYQLTGGRLTYLSASELILHKRERLENLFSIADAVITLSQWYYDVMLINQMPIHKLRLVKQGFGGRPDAAPATSVYNRDHPLRILFLGRILPEKGLHLLLTAIRSILPDHVQVSIYGQFNQDDYYATCRQMADTLPNVCWHGPIPPDRVLTVMQQHDVLCIPSTLAEMAPLVLQEARAVGLCIIGADIGGIKDEIADNDTGWLFAVNDAVQLTSIIERIILDPALLQKVRGRQPRPRSFKTVMEEINIIYSEVLNRTSGIAVATTTYN